MEGMSFLDNTAPMLEQKGNDSFTEDFVASLGMKMPQNSDHFIASEQLKPPPNGSEAHQASMVPTATTSTQGISSLPAGVESPLNSPSKKNSSCETSTTEAEDIVRKLCQHGKLMEFQEGKDFIKVIVYEEDDSDKEINPRPENMIQQETFRQTPLSHRSGIQERNGPSINHLIHRTSTPVSHISGLNSSGEEIVSPPDIIQTPTSEQLQNRVRSLIDFPQYQILEESGKKIREQHNQKERRRRARIKEACNLLRQLVPGMSDKTDKATVFEFAARYVHFLKSHSGAQYDKDFLMKYSPY
ncbi:helix loop helix domain [Mactra antiquata]